jgi:hypothetical protein
MLVCLDMNDPISHNKPSKYNFSNCTVVYLYMRSIRLQVGKYSTSMYSTRLLVDNTISMYVQYIPYGHTSIQ